MADGRVVQRHVLYLGEINVSKSWRGASRLKCSKKAGATTDAVAVSRRSLRRGDADESIVRVRLSHMRLCRPRQWGACWLVVKLWRELQLDRFWAERLPASRKGHAVGCSFVGPGGLPVDCAGQRVAACTGNGLNAARWRIFWERISRWRRSISCTPAMICCSHISRRLFDHLVGRWRDLFNASFDVLLYDLTSTYFETDPPFPRGRQAALWIQPRQAIAIACRWSLR